MTVRFTPCHPRDIAPNWAITGPDGTWAGWGAYPSEFAAQQTARMLDRAYALGRERGDEERQDASQ